MARKKSYNPEKRQWRGASYKAGRERIAVLREKAHREVQPAETLFTCRCCGESSRGLTDGTFFDPGWGRIDRIDGPNAICPECIADPESLEGLKEDGFESAAVKLPS